MSEILHKALPSVLKKVLPTVPDLESIRQMTGNADMSSDDVFCFSMDLATDQYDRTHERFPESYLKRFEETIVGKSFLTGHDYDQAPRGRYYDGSVIKHPRGQGMLLLAKAFVDAQDTQAVRAITLGIWKDVSIGFRAGKRVCDICGKQWLYGFGDDGYCNDHWPGEKDANGVLCRLTYTEPERAEAMEGSAVWLGAQPGAQMTINGRSLTMDQARREWMTKRAGAPPARAEGRMDEELMKKAVSEAEQKAARLQEQIEAQKGLIEDGKAYRAALRAEIQRKYTLCGMEATGSVILAGMPDTTGAEALKAAESEVQRVFDAKFPPKSQSEQRNPEQNDRKVFNPATAWGR